MKNKLFKKKYSIPLIGLSLVLSGGILFNHSHAYTIIYPSHTCSYSWSITRSAPYKAKNKCSCGDLRKTYSYNDPTVTLTLNNEYNRNSSVTTPNNIVAFEEGVKLTSGTNYLKSTAKDNDGSSPSRFSDSIIQHNLSINGNKKVNLLTSTAVDISSLKQGKYTMKATCKDEYYKSSNSDAATQDFYVGPYPTIYYNAHLVDDNTSNHKDKITIENIKLRSTYKPSSLTFYIYANGTFHSIKTAAPSKSDFYYDANGNAVGYISQFPDFTITTLESKLKNILPLTKPYIMVKVNDGRTGSVNSTDPSKPKYAKYSTAIASI